MSHRQNSKRVLQFARDLGYELTHTGSGHWLARHPCGAVVTLSNTVRENLGKKEMARLRNEKARRTAA